MSYNPERNVYEGFLYLVTNIINDFKYVGQTTRTIDIRWYQHTHVKPTKSNITHFDQVINELGAQCFKIEEIKKYAFDDYYDLKKCLDKEEKKYIKLYNSLIPKYGGRGYNVDSGGWSGLPFCKPVDVYNMDGELVATYMSRVEVAAKYNTDALYVGRICLGYVPNYKGLCVFRNSGEPFDKYETKSKFYDNIYQFTLDGYLVGCYHTRKEVVDKYNLTFLREIIDNPYRIGYGYWWSTTNEFRYIGEENKGTRKITVYNLFGEAIKKFDSLEQCRKYYHYGQRAIINNCEGRTPFLNSKIFRYGDDSFYLYSEKFNNQILHELLITEYAIEQKSINGRFVIRHKSIREAIDYLKENHMFTPTISPALILKCCLGDRNIVGGYQWSFYFDNEQMQ